MMVSSRTPLQLIIAVAVAAILAGCPLPFEFNGKDAGAAHSSDPSSPNMTAPVTVSYAEQGGTSGSIADGSSFVSGKTTTVTLSTVNLNAVIFYTDDGTALTDLRSAKKINASSGTFTITRTTTAQSLDIHAVAVGSNMLPSPAVHVTVGVSPYPILSITRDNASISEDGGTATFTITSSSASASDIIVNLVTGGDYGSGEVTGLQARGLPPFQATLTAGTTKITIPITANHDANGVNETVSLTIQADSNNPPSYTVGVPSTAAILIQDDYTPVLTVSASLSSILDSGGVTVFTVNSSFAPTSALTVNLLTGGAYKPSDVTGIPALGSKFALVLPAGQTTATVSVTAHPDIGEYLNETVIVSLVTDPTYTIGTQGSATVTIVDTSPVGTLTLTADRTMMSDGQTATYTVTTSVAPEANLTVNISSSGYTAGKVVVPTSVTISTGSLSTTFAVTAPLQAGYPEQNPQISLAPGTGYIVGNPGAQSLLITDTAYTFKGLWDFSGGSVASSVAGAPAWTLNGTVSIVNASLSFNGSYPNDYAATDVSSILNQNQFTLGVSFRMTDLSATHVIVVGGYGWRWLMLQTDPTTGELFLVLNNHSVNIDLGFAVTAGTDHTVLVSIDTATLSVIARFDGVQHTASLPGGFAWNNINSVPAFFDQFLTSDDFSSGNVFPGLWHWIYVANGVLN